MGPRGPGGPGWGPPGGRPAGSPGWGLPPGRPGFGGFLGSCLYVLCCSCLLQDCCEAPFLGHPGTGGLPPPPF
ncbi:unnamed protein product [Urochloa decumbens]|uniref:Uncharacterized protein n=1 Tax=Urochloa decumbens TaxID=240449 RepID=A0ABC8YYY1_9POAL